MNVKIYRNISEINESQWNAAVDKGRIFCSYKYLEALEKSGMHKDRCYYVVVYERNEIIAHLSAYFIRTELDLFAKGPTRKVIEAIRRKFRNFFVLQSIECGPPIALGNTLSFKNGVNRAEAMQMLHQGIEGLAKNLGTKLVLFRDFYESDKDLCEFLKGHGYQKIHNLPKAEIKIRWKSFDEYLDSMRSSYRCKITKGIEKCSGVDISVRELKSLSGDQLRELKKLYDNVSNKAKEIKREHLPEAYFQNLHKYFGEKAVVISATKDNKMIGFMLAVFNDKELIASLVGIDYNHSRQHHTYFNIFYRTLELAIKKGMEKVDMGITTLDPKRNMGSDIVALNMYIKHSNSLLNKIIPPLFEMITPPDTTEPRNVFKDIASPS